MRCLWISHYANMVIVKVSLSSEKLLAFMSIFFAHATCSHVLSPGCKHHRVTRSRQGTAGGGSSCEAMVRISLPALHPDSRRESLNLLFNKNPCSQAQVSTRPALTSPARCSCDPRALSAPHGGRRLQRVESMACRIELCNVGYFYMFTLDTVRTCISQ